MQDRPTLLIFAAASLTDVFTELGTAFTKATQILPPKFVFGASGTLLSQIQAGATADVFVPASKIEADTLQQAKQVAEADAPAVFATNRLAVIVPKGSKLTTLGQLKSADVKRVALSDPRSVPAGRYAKQMLEKRGLWSVMAKKAVYGNNVRQTLVYVTGGNVDAGIVFATDAKKASDTVRVLTYSDPARDHEPIVYPAVVLKNSPHLTEARAFVRFLQTQAAQSILIRYGFGLPKRGR